MNRDAICRPGEMPSLIYRKETAPDLPAGLEGKCILFVTDIHFGRWFGQEKMEELVLRMNAAAPDVLILGGDLAEKQEDEEQVVSLLAKVKAPLGAFCVPGNNDFEAFAGHYDTFRRLLKDAGIRLLINRRFETDVEGGRLVVTGLDEAKHGKPDGACLAVRRKPGDFHVLAAHSPWALDAALADVQDPPQLALCGHTHGGQISLGPLSLYSFRRKGRDPKASRYFSKTGERNVDGTRVIVSNGIGASILPVRMGAGPQMHLISLKRAEE